MNRSPKYWLVLALVLLAISALACSLGSLTPQATPTQVIPPSATPVTEPNPSLTGFWMDPDTSDVHSIVWQADGYVVMASQSATDTLSITSQSWSQGVLTWSYLDQETGVSVTFTSTSVSPDSLYTSWTNTDGGSGTETLQRVASPVPPQAIATLPPGQSIAGRWNDPDTTGTVTTIVAQGNGFAVESVINPDRGGNELTQTNWSNGILTWTYCIPGGNCITSVTVSVVGDSLYTTWTDDRGYSGETNFDRLSGTPDTVQPAGQTMAGRWNDPDTTGTVTTIVAQGSGFAVESVINPDRGVNELTQTDWANGVLTWTYCISGGNCITSETVYLDGDNLYTTWTDDRGYSGETTFGRLP